MTILKPKVHFGTIDTGIFPSAEKLAAENSRNLSIVLWGIPLSKVKVLTVYDGAKGSKIDDIVEHESEFVQTLEDSPLELANVVIKGDKILPILDMLATIMLDIGDSVHNKSGPPWLLILNTKGSVGMMGDKVVDCRDKYAVLQILGCYKITLGSKQQSDPSLPDVR